MERRGDAGRYEDRGRAGARGREVRRGEGGRAEDPAQGGEGAGQREIGRSERRREVGRGERVLPGLWRLRLPLPWAGIPHCNAWAIAAGDGIVLVDTGVHEAGSMAQLRGAMAQVNLRVEHVRLVACTHAHADHWGQAAPIAREAGCEVWLHPNHRHATDTATDRDLALARRLEIGRQSGVPEAVLERYAIRARDLPSGIAEVIESDRALVDGVRIDSDLGAWEVIETPGHAPSHICLLQRERRLLISGDHLLGRVSPYFDYGWSPDPVAEFLSSLARVDELGVRLCLSGHGRPFLDVHGHVEANQKLVASRLAAVASALAERPGTAMDIAPEVHGGDLRSSNAHWWLSETLCYLTHLERAGRVRRREDEQWVVA